jgi:hypothetical protein
VAAFIVNAADAEWSNGIQPCNHFLSSCNDPIERNYKYHRLILRRELIITPLDSLLESALGQSRPMHSAPAPTNVRFAPKATKMVRRGE